MDNTDLVKICDVVENDTTLSKLIIAGNMFTDVSPLLELIKSNGGFLKFLDLGQCPFNDNVLRQMTTVVLSLTGVLDLSLQQVFQDSN